MEQMKKWRLWYSHTKPNVEREIREIDIFEANIAELLKRYFKRGDLILDAGCGTGRFCFWLEREGIQAVGIDIAFEAIKLANNYARNKGFNTPLVVGDISKLPFRDNSFDGYICIGVIEDLNSTNNVIQALWHAKRILKNGGKCIIKFGSPFAIIRNRILFKISSGRLGFCSKLYTLNTVCKLAQIFSSKYDLIAYDMWVPIYNIIDGILGRLEISKIFLYKTRLIFGNLISIPLLKYFFGYIYLVMIKS